MTQKEVLDKVIFQAQLRGLSKATQNSYYFNVKLFQQHIGKPANELGIKEVQKYLHYIHTERKLTIGSVNICVSSLRFLYNKALRIPIDNDFIPRVRKTRKLPVILTKDEIRELINACDNLRDKTILAITYSAGLRLNETTCLRVQDIDSKNMKIYIADGKGGKDRFAILADSALFILREYYKQFKPPYWLFYSRIHTETHMTPHAVQNVLKRALRFTGIKKNISMHSLRYSFATHLPEDGINIFHIKELLGHSKITSTAFYLHLVKIENIGKVSPLDTIKGVK